MKMLLKNQDIMEGILFKNSDVMNKMMEVMPQIGNTTNNNTNSHNTTNNQFNINMFLNEHCKNAMNLTDFIESLPITNKTYDDTIENGLTKTITNMMVNGLKELDILDRPIHCTDTKRKTLYVKEADIWEKDDELNKILQGIKGIALKQRTMINKWQDVNDGWDQDEDLQTKLTKLVFNSMTSIEDDEKETNKIIRAIGKNTYLDNQIHIAHNVKIGENSIIAGQVGIAGSSIIGKNAKIGGQAGISGHLKIGNNVEIAGGSGVIKDIPDNSKVMGYPAKNIRQFLKENR